MNDRFESLPPYLIDQFGHGNRDLGRVRHLKIGEQSQTNAS